MKNFLSQQKRQKAYVLAILQNLAKGESLLKKFFTDAAEEFSKTDEELKAWEAAFEKRNQGNKKSK
jgi:hypothetical protein